MEPPTALSTSMTNTARTGANLSGTILELLSAASYRPKEVSEAAKAVVDLSETLGHLGYEWGPTGPGTTIKGELERQVTSALECIATLYGEIRALIDPASAAARLLWAFRRARWRSLHWQAESYKAGVWTILTILTLAFRLKCVAVYVLTFSPSLERPSWLIQHEPRDCEDDLNRRIALTRQQSQNWVQTCHQAVRLLVAEYDERQQLDDVETEDADSQALIVDTKTDSNAMYFTRTRFIEDVVFWLYDVEFSSMAEESRQHHRSSENAGKRDHTAIEAATSPTSCFDYGAQEARYMGKLRLLIRSPPNNPAVVNKLISRWTTLPKRHIYLMHPETDPEPKEAEPGPAAPSETSYLVDDVGPPLDVLFTDARGRKYRIPWDIAKTWVVSIARLVCDEVQEQAN